MSRRHTLPQHRPAFAAALALVLAALLLSSPPALAQSPPGPVSSVSLSRADGTLTASWDAVPGATKYHVTYSSNGGASWSLAALDHAESSITFSADNAKTYVVGVRAGNDHGWSGWKNSPAAGPYTPPAPAPPGTPSSVTVTRADGTVTATWPAPAGATSYHVTYTDNGKQSWQLAALDHPADDDGDGNESITFSADNAKTYVVGVRAKNSGGGSNWRNSPAAGPYTPPTPRGIIVQDSSGNAITALSVPEGGEASYQVKLTAPPTEDVEVCIGLSVRGNNDSDITFKDEAGDVVAIKLTFTPGNWNTAQTVTLVAAEDNDYLDGARDVTHDAREYYGGRVDWTATEIDNDEITAPARPSGLTATEGDGTVTLSWEDPGDQSITGYEYRLNHNDTTTGNFSGWGPWTAVAGSGAATTSHALTGLTNGTEQRFKLRAVNTVGNSAAAPSAAPWYVAATPDVPSLTASDATPTSAVLTMGAWSGAWHYRASENAGSSGASGASASGQSGQSGCVGPINGSQTTITGLDPDTSYTVDAYGDGGCGGAAIASSGAIMTQGPISLAVSAPTTEGVTLTIAGHTGDWWYAAVNGSSGCAPASGASAVITGLRPGRAYAYGAYGNKWCHPSDNTLATASFTTKYELRADGVTENSATLVINGSGLLTNWWYKRTAPAGDNSCRAVPHAHKSVNLALTRSTSYAYAAYGDAGCADQLGAVSFKTPGLDHSVDSNTDTATLNLRNWDAAWWYLVIHPDGGTCTPVAAGTTSVTITVVINENNDHSIVAAYSAAGCDADDEIARAVFFPGPKTRGGVANVTATTATLLAYNTGGNDWEYRSTAAGAPCAGPFSSPGNPGGVGSQDVTGLTPGASYTYRLYRFTPGVRCQGSAVYDEDVTFKTALASVSNLSQPRVGTTRPVGWTSGHWIANAFTTGRGASSFTLERITVLFGDSSPMPRPLYDLRVQIFSSGAGGEPGTALATLSGPARPDENAEAVYTCSGGGCALLPGATYHVVLSVPGVTGSSGRHYAWQRAGTAHETASPAGSGWRIANDGWHTHDGGATWTRLDRVAMFSVEYGAPDPALTANAITETAATLTLANEGTEGAWYAKRISPTAGTCSSALGAAGLGLTELTAGTRYTYAAYRDPACTAVVTSATFTTLKTLTASNVTDTTATLSIAGHTGAWYAKYTSPAVGTCSSAINEDATDLMSLIRNATYTFEAYSDSGCTTVIGRTTFTTEANWLAVSVTGTTTAELTLTGHTGSWYVKETSPATGTCSLPVASGATHNLDNLTKGTTYSYGAFSDSGCTAEIRSVTFNTLIDTPTNVTFSTSSGNPQSTSNVSWRRNSAATGNVGYELEVQAKDSTEWTDWTSQSPSEQVNYNYSQPYFGAPYKYVRVRAYKNVGGVTYYSNWVTVESAATV